MEVKRCTNMESHKYNRMYGSTIRINRADYKLFWVKEIMLEGQQLSGLCNIQDKVIYIDVTHELEETLAHEICHAEFHEAGLKQHDKWDTGLEEIIAETISRGLIGNFKIRRKK